MTAPSSQCQMFQMQKKLNGLNDKCTQYFRN